MTSKSNLNDVSTPRKIVLGSAVVLLISSFLPWYHFSIDLGPFGSSSSSANGWHSVGVVAWLLVIALLALEGTRIAGVLPLEKGRAELATAATAGAAVLFTLIFVIVRLSDGFLGFGFFIGLIAMLVLAFGTFGLFRSGSAMSAMKDLQGSKGREAN